MALLTWAAFLLVLDLIAEPAAALYSAEGPVVNLSPSNFDSQLREGVWLVEFYAPWCGHCKALKPAWDDVAKGLKGIVKVGAVDADTHRDLAQRYKIQGFPTIKFMYTSKDGKITKTDHNGARSASALIEWALSQAKKVALQRIGAKAEPGSGDSKSGSRGTGSRANGGGSFYSADSEVFSLTAGNFADEVLSSENLWLVEFYAPWCGHCKNLKPAWEEAAAELKGKVSVGAVDCTAQESLCGQYGVQGFPTIKFWGLDKGYPEEYQGGRDAGSIVQFAVDKWSAQMPAPQVNELGDQYAFDENCLGDPDAKKAGKQVCFVAFLPHILDSGVDGRKQFLNTLSKVAEKFKGRQFSYFWSEGGSQPDLEANLQVGGYGYPALVAFNPSKQMFSSMRYSFIYEHITDFVNDLKYGGSAPIIGKLASIKTVNLWDGTGSASTEEDEFSLDDIMNEEL